METKDKLVVLTKKDKLGRKRIMIRVDLVNKKTERIVSKGIIEMGISRDEAKYVRDKLTRILK